MSAHGVASIDPAGEGRERLQCACGWATARSGRTPEAIDRALGEAHDAHLRQELRRELEAPT